MPGDNLKGWRRDVVALMKELDSPVYRWPGGNFVSGYNLMDGIGDRDILPPRKNKAWKGVEPNDVGIHEYMELMKLIFAFKKSHSLSSLFNFFIFTKDRYAAGRKINC